MQFYKDLEGKVHCLDDVAFVHLLPEGCVEITAEEAAALLAPPPPTKEQKVQAVKAAVQGLMDSAAQSAGYDDIKSAVTYADEPEVPKFQNEGRAFRRWRSDVWFRCYALLADVDGGTIPEPTIEELIAMLPSLVMP